MWHNDAMPKSSNEPQTPPPDPAPVTPPDKPGVPNPEDMNDAAREEMNRRQGA